jgi:cysteine desulfurase
MEAIYLDHNATTPVDPRVVDAMLPYFTERFGNASSVHQYGRTAKVALENARDQIAAFINCEPSELFFTSGGTESDNLAIFGSAYTQRGKKDHLIVCSTEHHAILEPAEHLHKKEGFRLDLLPVDSQGFAAAETLRTLVHDKTILLSIMHANNETGSIQDLKTLADVAHEKGALVHSDAVQSVGKIKVDVRALGLDMMTLTGHKIYGPKGIGGLFIRQGIKLTPLIYGGSHEKKRRPGTENVAGAVGFAKALEIAGKEMDDDFNRIWKLAEKFIADLMSTIPDVKLNSPTTNRIPQTVNVSFVGLTGEPIILSLDMEGIAVASGSACTSGATEPSHVLTAMGIPPLVANGAIRFSLGRSTTQAQLDHLLKVLPGIIERLRAMSGVNRN